jgi:heme/copper-type cytochrome/quinol oxidase subunit 3
MPARTGHEQQHGHLILSASDSVVSAPGQRRPRTQAVRLHAVPVRVAALLSGSHITVAVVAAVGTGSAVRAEAALLSVLHRRRICPGAASTLSSENTVRSRSVVVSITRYTHFLFVVWIS